MTGTIANWGTALTSATKQLTLSLTRAECKSALTWGTIAALPDAQEIKLARNSIVEWAFTTPTVTNASSKCGTNTWAIKYNTCADVLTTSHAWIDGLSITPSTSADGVATKLLYTVSSTPADEDTMD